MTRSSPSVVWASYSDRVSTPTDPTKLNSEIFKKTKTNRRSSRAQAPSVPRAALAETITPSDLQVNLCEWRKFRSNVDRRRVVSGGKVLHYDASAPREEFYFILNPSPPPRETKRQSLRRRRGARRSSPSGGRPRKSRSRKKTNAPSPSSLRSFIEASKTNSDAARIASSRENNARSTRSRSHLVFSLEKVSAASDFGRRVVMISREG